MSDRYEWTPYRDGEAPPTVTEVLLPAPRRPHIDYRRVFAWKPVDTEDGRKWLCNVWKMTVDGQASGYAHTILPLGFHR